MGEEIASVVDGFFFVLYNVYHHVVFVDRRQHLDVTVRVLSGGCVQKWLSHHAIRRL